MGARTEAEVDSEILRHDARNLQLRRRLAERGIDLRGEHPITCEFRARNAAQASQLAKELGERGFRLLELSPAGFRDHPIWRLRVQAEGTIGQALSHEFTEAMVRSAAAFSCLYDGWGAVV